jgi:hypothetical protein
MFLSVIMPRSLTKKLTRTVAHAMLSYGCVQLVVKDTYFCRLSIMILPGGSEHKLD